MAHPSSPWIATAHKAHPVAYHRFIESPYGAFASGSTGTSTSKTTARSDASSVPVERVQRKLLRWYDTVKDDRAMPWRKEVDLASLTRQERNQRGYEIWVSEIMLQQTQVATVKAYFKRWMERFPTVDSLAEATDEQVHAVWKGLGYYSRATRLLKGAKTVVNDFDGHIPTSAADLQKVDGIGPYSAGAISSIAFGKRSAMVDGNVQRVISRLCAIHANPTAKATTNLIWSIADSLVPPLDFDPATGKKHPNPPGAFNQALMELGATVCTPANPSCSKCPLNEECLALAEVKHKASSSTANADTTGESDQCQVCESRPARAGEVTVFPMKKEKKKAREEETVTAIVEYDKSHVLVIKRPSKGLLAGFYEFPSVDLETVDEANGEVDTDNEEARAKLMRKYLRSLLPTLKQYGEVRTKHVASVLHLYSHQHRTYHVSLYSIAPASVSVNANGLPVLAEGANAKWVPKDEVDDVTLGGAMVRAWAIRQGRPDPNGPSGTKAASASSSSKKKKRPVSQAKEEGTDLRSFFGKDPAAQQPERKKKRVIVVGSDEED